MFVAIHIYINTNLIPIYKKKINKKIKSQEPRRQKTNKYKKTHLTN